MMLTARYLVECWTRDGSEVKHSYEQTVVDRPGWSLRFTQIPCCGVCGNPGISTTRLEEVQS